MSFGARYIKSATVLKNNKNLDKHAVAFVELNPTDIRDIACINRLNFEWGGIKTLTRALANNMNSIFFEEVNAVQDRFFVLTQQKGNYEDLSIDDILSVAETSVFDDKIISIDFLETKFKESHNALDSRFKHIVTEMINNLKFLFRGKDLLV